jgi:hypothetical protein
VTLFSKKTEGSNSDWLYHYSHTSEPWQLAIATHAPPGSQKLSLGGFRIAPVERTQRRDFGVDREARELAIGMEEKIQWSRLLRIGGPLAKRDIDRIVGGKCVLLPTDDSRVGQPRDREMLDFAIACLNDCQSTAGIHITTGQDLGHGILSDGKTSSLDYLNRGFPGSVVVDTAIPTAEGNYYVLRGMLRGLAIELSRSNIGLIGVGNIGSHILERLRKDGSRILALESLDKRRAEIAALEIETWAPAAKDEFLRQPMQALVVNAAGGSLDSTSINACVWNKALRVVCGSENLAMPDPAGATRLQAARKLYCPTELGGMMGYLTAAEAYLAHVEGQPFQMSDLMEAAKALEDAGLRGAERARKRKFEISFEDAIRLVFTR